MALKLGKTVLIEIIAIVQKGLLEGMDISQQLRDVELELSGDPQNETVELAPEYVIRRNQEN